MLKFIRLHTFDKWIAAKMDAGTLSEGLRNFYYWYVGLED